MPEFAIYRRYADSLFHSRAVTVEATNLVDVVGKLNAGIAGHFEVKEGDVLLVRRLDASDEADAINMIEVNVPKPRFARV